MPSPYPQTPDRRPGANPQPGPYRLPQQPDTPFGNVMTPNQDPTDDQPQLLLGRYRVVETRGTGGFGAVYVCWDVRLERKVAIKCLPLAQAEAAASASSLDEALREARTLSGMQHPNVVTVYDFEVAGGYALLIMEYVDGLTLAELMARVEGGVLTYDECAHLLDSLACALDYAHGRGVLHLDIKPSNVFVAMDGTIKLGDFGMASLASAAGWEGARGGTVGYMPPEQLQIGLVDQRTDVFALAVVCYQALTGISPFAAADAEASLKKIVKGAKALAKIEAPLAGTVSDQIALALSPDPAIRPSSAGALADALLPIMGDDQEGRASIADLMEQATGETGPDEEAWERAAHVRLIERYPRLPDLMARGVAALVGGSLASQLAPIAAAALSPAPAGTLTLAGALGAAALCFALPATGMVIMGAALVLAILTCGVYSPAFLVALLAGVALGVWWVRVGSDQGMGHPVLGRSVPASRLGGKAQVKLAAASLMAGPALGAAAAATLAGAALAPSAAGFTAALGALLAPLATALSDTARASLATGVAPDPDEFVRLCVTAFSSLGIWVVAAGCGIAATLASLIGRRGTTLRVSIAQLLSGVVLVLTVTAGTRVENGGLWGAEPGVALALAVGFSVLMGIVLVTLGSEPKQREGELS